MSDQTQTETGTEPEAPAKTMLGDLSIAARVSAIVVLGAIALVGGDSCVGALALLGALVGGASSVGDLALVGRREDDRHHRLQPQRLAGVEARAISRRLVKHPVGAESTTVAAAPLLPPQGPAATHPVQPRWQGENQAANLFHAPPQNVGHQPTFQQPASPPPSDPRSTDLKAPRWLAGGGRKRRRSASPSSPA